MAAANPIGGRYDPTMNFSENVSLNYNSSLLFRIFSCRHCVNATSKRKLLCKLGNIVSTALCFLPMFPCLSSAGNSFMEPKLFPGSKNVS